LLPCQTGTYSTLAEHQLQDEREYTAWDLHAVRRSDWILAHLEPGNPGGYALALEVGFAKALGKRIIFVDAKSAMDEHAGRYLGMIRMCADLTPATLEDAIAFLASARSANSALGTAVPSVGH
jgi:nucleoside 2-deoxyribosyltransferase